MLIRLMCEHCGSGTTPDEAVTTQRGVVRWVACPRCAKASQDRDAVFGAPAMSLPDPMGGVASWWTYRLACEELRYTLWTATSRKERDALHARWNGWMARVMAMQDDRGTLLYRNALEGSDFVNEAGHKWPGPHLSERWVAWLLPRVTHESKRHLLTRAPDRATLEAALGVPKRGSLVKPSATRG